MSFLRANNRFLWGFALSQIVLLAIVLVYYGARQEQCKTDLETHAPEALHSFTLSASDVLDQVSFLSGTEEAGIALPTEARQKLNFCPGQMMWGMLRRPTASSAGQAEPEGNVYSEDLWDVDLPASSRDGVVSFLYDLGDDTACSYANWSGTAVFELQASPLLPWQKHLDFVVLSSLEELNAGGLPFITDLNPKTLLIAPPLDMERLYSLGRYESEPRVVQYEEGLHLLLPGMWLLVLPTPEKYDSRYELDIILERGDGSLMLLVGSALNPPIVHLRAAETQMGKRISWYAGGTGWSDDGDMLRVEADLRQIEQEFPELDWQPNFNTGMFVRDYMQEALGERYHNACLGSVMRCE